MAKYIITNALDLAAKKNHNRRMIQKQHAKLNNTQI